MQERTDRTPSYQVCHHLLHVLGALLHLILGPSKLDDVALVRWIREVDDNLQGVIIDSKLKQTQELLCQTHAKIREILYILCPIQKRVATLASLW